MDALKKAIFELATSRFRDGAPLPGFEEESYILTDTAHSVRTGTMSIEVGDREFTVIATEQPRRGT